MQKKIFYSETILVLLLLYFLFFFGFYFNEDADGGSILIDQAVNYENIAQAFYLNVAYLAMGISLFYYSFRQARKKGSLINIGE